MLISDKSRLKRNVEQIDFGLCLKLARVLADLTDSGRLFRTVGPTTEKARSPNLVLVHGTMKSRLLAERRRWCTAFASDWLNGFTQVHETAIFMYHKHQKQNLVPDTMINWQPVQLLQRWMHMIAWWHTKCNPSSRGRWLIEVAYTEQHCSSQVDWRWKRIPAGSWYQCPRDDGVAEAGIDGKSCALFVWLCYVQEYCSILYLKPRMKIVLRNKKVQTKLVAKSLKKTQIDWYRPRFLVSFCRYL